MNKQIHWKRRVVSDRGSHVVNSVSFCHRRGIKSLQIAGDEPGDGEKLYDYDFSDDHDGFLESAKHAQSVLEEPPRFFAPSEC